MEHSDYSKVYEPKGVHNYRSKFMLNNVEKKA